MRHRDALIAHAPAFGGLDGAALEQALGAAWTTLSTAPRLAAKYPHFLHMIARLVPADAKAFVRLASLHVADAYLAVAALAGDPAALSVLYDTHLVRVPSFVAKIDRSPAFASEVVQDLAQKLLMRTEKAEARLATYDGTHPLDAWLRIVAVRTAQDVARRRRTHEGRTDPLDGSEAAGGHDPELALLRAKYSAEFKEAFRSTLSELDVDQRNILRLHYLDGLTLEEVARTYRISRATAARWIASARERLRSETYRILRERLGDGVSRSGSIIALVENQLDVSISQFLK